MIMHANGSGMFDNIINNICFHLIIKIERVMLTGTHSWIQDNQYYETKNINNLSQKRRVVPDDNISRC